MRFLPENCPKNGQNCYFWPKMPEKLPFLPENDVYTQAASMEVAEAPLYRFSENFYSIPLPHLVN